MLPVTCEFEVCAIFLEKRKRYGKPRYVCFILIKNRMHIGLVRMHGRCCCDLFS